MSTNLLTQPRCNADDLGQPMPDSPHAVSACLPLWAHNIGYEEGDANVIDRLLAAYPRFCLNPFVKQLCSQTFTLPGATGFVFPSHAAARRAADYVRFHQGTSARLIEIPGQSLLGVAVSADEYGILKQYWQHAGEITSSRAAQQILKGHRVTFGTSDTGSVIRNRVAELQNAHYEDVWLFPSRMRAMAPTWRAVGPTDPVSPSVQFGFPYVDTLKMQQRFQPAECRFYPVGADADIDRLEAELKTQPICAVFCETPANPLLTCPDLMRLRSLADEYGFLLIVDDTLAACINLNVMEYADAVVTSLTKYFSGYGDVLAGSVTLNPSGKHYQRLHRSISAEYECLLADVDLEVLERNSRDVRTRVDKINTNAATLAQRLSRHSKVARIYHPSIVSEDAPDRRHYEGLRRQDGGYGGLLSIVLHDPERTTIPVFDALQFCKGPNLGTVFTLCCPYTILAHYTELDFVESCGVSRWLLRISVGIEPVEDLWKRLDNALSV